MGLCRDSAQRVAKAAPGVGEGRGRGRQPPRQRFGPLPPTDAAGASGDFQPGREGEEENKQIKEVVALSWWLFFVFFFFLFVRLFCGFPPLFARD